MKKYYAMELDEWQSLEEQAAVYRAGEVDAALADKDREIAENRTVLCLCKGALLAVMDVVPQSAMAREILTDVTAAIARIDAMKERT